MFVKGPTPLSYPHIREHNGVFSLSKATELITNLNAHTIDCSQKPFETFEMIIDKSS